MQGAGGPTFSKRSSVERIFCVSGSVDNVSVLLISPRYHESWPRQSLKTLLSKLEDILADAVKTKDTLATMHSQVDDMLVAADAVYVSRKAFCGQRLSIAVLQRFLCRQPLPDAENDQEVPQGDEPVELEPPSMSLTEKAPKVSSFAPERSDPPPNSNQDPQPPDRGNASSSTWMRVAVVGGAVMAAGIQLYRG